MTDSKSHTKQEQLSRCANWWRTYWKYLRCFMPGSHCSLTSGPSLIAAFLACMHLLPCWVALYQHPPKWPTPPHPQSGALLYNTAVVTSGKIIMTNINTQPEHYNPSNYSIGRHVFFSRNLSDLSGGVVILLTFVTVDVVYFKPWCWNKQIAAFGRALEKCIHC